jgi:adenosylhomocysteine nucleosidase
MEAAGAARAAQDLGVPFYCIRAVSDLADENFVNDLNASFMPDGRISVVRLMFGALRNPPKHIGELVRLNKRAAVAANNLGEFLANCAF